MVFVAICISGGGTQGRYGECQGSMMGMRWGLCNGHAMGQPDGRVMGTVWWAAVVASTKQAGRW